MRVLTRFVTSAADPRQFPSVSAPEIAFLGRSNVGKSSLINALVGDKKMAKTSNTPGRTQTINFYEVRRPGKPRPEFLFVDLPGYGYARAPKEITAKWADFINPYLEKRPTLALCLSLVDVTIPPQHLDIQLVHWLQHVARPFVVVATKADRVSNNQLRHSLSRLAEQLEVAPERIVPFSAKARIGYDELWKRIREAAFDDGEPAEPLARSGTSD